jgi:acetyltransferase-like isoleucine patch superfamily enzyme
MSHTIDRKSKLQQDRWALRDWLRAGASAPLVLDRDEQLGPWDVLCRSRAGRIGRGLASLAILLANALPFSSWKIALYRSLGVRIGRGVYIAPGVVIDPMFPELITLEDGCFLGMGCRLLTHEITADSIRAGRITVQAGAVVGGYATIRSGVRIGQRATVGCNSFVNRDVPPGTMVGGVPARELRIHREDPS